MNQARSNPFRRGIFLAIVLALNLLLLLHAALAAAPTAPPANHAERSAGALAPGEPSATNTLSPTFFLPVVLNEWCAIYQSPRLFLSGTDKVDGDAEITAPANCAIGLPSGSVIMASGTYTGWPAEVDLWVLVYASNFLYYPQSPDACAGQPARLEGDRWEVPVFLGVSGGEAEWFDIVVVAADSAASSFLSTWLQDGCATEFRGIPSDQLRQMKISEKDAVSVQTVD